MVDREKGIKTIDEMAAIAEELRSEDKKVVTTNGTFDLYHAAHARFFSQAKQFGDVLVVLLNSDSSVRRNKGELRPYNHELDRAEVVASHKDVDYVVVFPEDKPLDYLAKIKGHVHVKGGSWIPERIKEEKDFVAQWDGEYKTLELEQGYSSTNIEQTILDRNK